MESRQLKILAIDDNSDNLITIQALIYESFSNIVVLKALNGKEGLKLAAQEDPDVILLDIVMPGMDGFEVCRRLKADKNMREIPVVFVTAIKGDKESRIKALECGAEAFLAKPIDESELIAQIRAMVKIKSAHLERMDENVRLAALVAERTSELKKTYSATLNLLEDLKNENEARKKTEESLRESEEKFRDMANLLPQIVFEIDYSGKLTYVNEQAYMIFGYDHTELLGRDSIIFHVPEERALITENIKLKLQGEEVDRKEYTMLRKDGTRFPALIYTSRVVKGDRTIGLRGIVIDVTEQKQSEEALRESEEKFREMAELLPQIVFESDLDGKLTYINKQAYKICGYDEVDEIKGVDSLSLYLPQNKEKELDYIRGRITGEQNGSTIIPVMRKNGSTFPGLMYANPIIRENKPVGVRGIIVDITEQKEAQEKVSHIARLYAFLSQINQAIVRTPSLEELLQTICEVAVEQGQFSMAWVGLLDEEQEIIKPFVFAGNEDDYLNEIVISSGFVANGNGPIGKAIKEGIIYNSNDIENDPLMEPWRVEALKRGYQSMGAVPLSRKGKILGSMNLYSSEKNFFNSDEQELLKEIGDDISFAINALDTEKLRKQTEEDLEQSRNELKTIYDHAPVMMCVVDEERHVVFSNQAFSDLTRSNEATMKGGAFGGVMGCINSLDNSMGCGHGIKCGDCNLRNAIKNTFKTGKGYRNIEYQSTLTIDGNSREVSLLGSTAMIRNDERKSMLLCLIDITDRKLTEEALQKSEMLLRTFIDNSPFEIWARDSHNVGILENKKLVDHYGSIIGLTPTSDLRIDQTTSHHWMSINERVLKGNIVDEEYQFEINNELHWFQQIVFPIKINEKIIGIAGFNIDINDKNQAKEALFQNNKRLELAMQVAKMAWWEMDMETGDILYGKMKTEMLGYSAKDFVHFNDFMDLVHPDDYEKTMDALKSYLLGNAGKYEAEYRILSSTGEYRWLYDLGNISKKDAEGKPMTVSGLVLDITDRKKAEKELYDQKQFFEQMFMQSSLSTQILDREGWCERINPKLSEIFGVEAKNMEGKVYNIFKDQEVIRHGILSKLEKVFKKGKTAEWEVLFDIGEAADSQQIDIKKKQKVWFNNWAYPIFEQNGEISHVIIQHTDITDRKMAEVALSLSQEQLKKFAAHLQNIREEERVLLAREIHDELGQILIAIKIDMGMLKQNVLKGIDPSQLEQVQVKFEGLFNLVDNTIKTARKIMTDLRPEVLDLLGFTEAVKQHLAIFQVRHNVKCTFINETYHLEFNSQQSVALFRIIQEALNNVAKHSKASEVTVYLIQAEDTLSLEIVDNGIGFDENHKKNSDSYGLIGMKERVFLLEGELEITGKKDVGTTVKVVMPFANPQRKTNHTKKSLRNVR